MKKLIVTIYLLMSVCLMAEIKVLEHFDYVVGASISDSIMDGGIGFADQWMSDSAFASNVDFDIVATNLVYLNYKQSSGNALRHYRTNSGDYEKHIYRYFSYTPIDITESKDMYMCFLFNIDDLDSNLFKLQYAGKDSSDDNINLNFVIPSAGNSGSVLVQGSGRSPDFDHVISGIQPGNNLMLLKISEDNSLANPDTNKYNMVEFWLNPDFPNLGPADISEYYCVSMFHGDGVDRMAYVLKLVVTLTNDSSYLFDEFMITDSLSDIHKAFGSIHMIK